MLNRFIVKQVNTFIVYDRLTGTIVGDTINEKVVATVLKPKGLNFDEKIEAAEAKIPQGQEQTFHDIVKKLRYSTELDKELEKRHG